MTVVVTGASGFIGSLLIDRLCALGHKVIGIDRRPMVPRAGLQCVIGDLVEPSAAIAEALALARTAFHLAACPGVRDQSPDVDQRRYRDNVLATERFLELVHPQAVVVAMSSSSVYGGVPLGRASREDDPLRPRGGYARSKVEMERVCESWRAAGGRLAVARPFTVVGEGQRRDMALSIWTRAVLRGEPIRVFGSPERTRDLTDVREVARVLIRLAELGVSETVNVGTGKAVALRDAVAVIAEVCGRTAKVVVEPAPDTAEVTHTCADTTRLRALTGSAPVTDLRDVVKRVVSSL